VLLSMICAFYVECKRPKRSSTSSSSSGSKKVKGHHQQLPSVSTLFTTTTSSTTSSSLDNSSPLPSRFSSLANLTTSGQKSSPPLLPPPNSGSSPQSSLPSFYYPPGSGGKKSTGSHQNPAESLYPISIVDAHSPNNDSSPLGYPSMSTDNSFYRLIENSASSPSTTLNHHHSHLAHQEHHLAHLPPHLQHHLQNPTLDCKSNDPASSLDPLNPTCSSYKSHQFSTASSGALKNGQLDPSSPFDLRRSSARGPAMFCFAFNHGPFLVSSKQFFNEKSPN